MESCSEAALVRLAPLDDAVGSFVGSIVKGDVARFGSLFNGHKLPWENDFAKSLLDPEFEWDALHGFKQDPVIPPLSAVARAEGSSRSSAKEATPGAIFAWAIALGAAARDPAAQRERKLDQGVSMWSQLVVRFAECCCLHDCVVEGLEAGAEISVAVSAAVAAAVGVKSPHTIHKRAASFWSFVRWLDVHEPLSANNLHEVQVWNYVQHLKATGAPATKASSVLSAFRFAHLVLGFRIDGIVQSKRIGGAAEQQLVNLRKLRQAKDLTVAQVLELHARLESEELHAFDRAFLAPLLIRLYARARPSDLLFIESVEIDCPAGADYPLLVFEVSQHKLAIPLPVFMGDFTLHPPPRQNPIFHSFFTIIFSISIPCTPKTSKNQKYFFNEYTNETFSFFPIFGHQNSKYERAPQGEKSQCFHFEAG